MADVKSVSFTQTNLHDCGKGDYVSKVKEFLENISVDSFTDYGGFEYSVKGNLKDCYLRAKISIEEYYPRVYPLVWFKK